MESWCCIWEDLLYLFAVAPVANPKIAPNLVPTNRSATPTVRKPSLLPHDVLPKVAFDVFRRGVKNCFRNDDKAERSLCANLPKPLNQKFNKNK